jgi:malate dehydrogenase (oxaloacetate-decarboxylating)
MLANTPRPVIFPLSNPTSSSEALPEDLVRWTHGMALVATGSPFAAVEYEGRSHPVGQGNNAFIFPGLGFGAVLSQAREVTDGMVLEAAYALYDYTSTHHPDRIYPPVGELREVSKFVAARVIRRAIQEGVARSDKLKGLDFTSLRDFVEERFWKPQYLPFKPAK